RGPARRARRGLRGRGDRSRGRGVRPAPAGVRRDRHRARGLGGRAQGPREGEPGSLQGPARDRVPGGAAAQRDRQGPQARARRPRAGVTAPGAVRIRPGTVADVPAMQALGARTWRAAYAGILSPEAIESGIAEFWNEWSLGSAARSGRILVAERDDAVVG